MTPVEEIKSKIAVEQLIGEYVPLKQSGTNFKGLCPFHQEKTPSFMVSPEKQIWHCFGCNEGGDIFTFIQKYEGIEFKEAIRELAQKTGVVLHGFVVPDQSKKRVLYDINEAARVFFQEELRQKNSTAVKTREYLITRGLTQESVDAWSLGLSPDSWDALSVNLLDKKFITADNVTAGLVISREQKLYDRFRRRLMFPIFDPQGRTVAFTARTLQYIVSNEEDQAGKYVNSPQTPIYNKSQILYGFDKAKQEIRRLQYAIIVEGNMDVIMSHQANTKNVVAVSGTALTLEQLQILKRYTQNIILSFDADTAGSQAVFRGITLAWDLDMNVKVIVLKEGKDPAEIIQKDPELWREAIKNSRGVVDFYFEEVFSRIDLSRADHKKQAARKITGIISKLKTKVEQAHYIGLLAAQLHIDEKILWPMLTASPATAIVDDVLLEPKKKPSLYSEHLLCFMLQFPHFIPTVINEIEFEMIAPELQELYKKIIIHYTNGQSTDIREIGNTLLQADLQIWSQLVFQGEQVYGALSPEQQERERTQLLHRVTYGYYTGKLHEISEAMKRAEANHDEEAVGRLLREHQALSKKRGT